MPGRLHVLPRPIFPLIGLAERGKVIIAEDWLPDKKATETGSCGQTELATKSNFQFSTMGDDTIISSDS